MSSNIFFSVGISDTNTRYLSTPNWFNPPFVFSGSKLPLIIINTNGGTIVDEPKITADLKIIHNETGVKNNLNDQANVYNGKIGIERRGASSYNYPQRPYLFETRNEDDTNNNVSILGMPQENDWILLSHYNDKTLMRNAISFDLFREMGHYSVRSRVCDVVINGQYEGIYLLCEKVKRDKNRVDIAKLKPEDNQGDDVTGGYIFKVDYNNGYDGWQSNFGPIDHPTYTTRFVYYYPDYDEIVGSQREYIKTFVDEFQYQLNQPAFKDNYNSYIHDSSFIDYFILNELARNVDGYKKSRYFHKDKDSKGGLIKAGPVWDFDWAWKNINDCDIFRHTDGSGWAYKVNDCYQTASPGWYVRLLQDPVFADKVNCRYFQLRETVLSDDYLNSKIDSIYNLVDNAQKGHFSKWAILGTRTGAPEVESPAQTYDEEVSRLRNWISTRLSWLDNNMVGESDDCLTSTDVIAENNSFVMYPNPASTHINLESNIDFLKVELYDFSGRIVLQKTSQYSRRVTIEFNNLKPGLYLTKSTFVNGKSQTNKLIIR
ncbi:MAG: CotH kinase family protein [Bacteroidetes bacterium]|nr:CotH kinase family protein [Bacteroidota bacterium]